MDVNECKRRRIIKRTKVDTERVKSLVETSEIKAIVVDNAHPIDLSINTFLPMAYDSLREVMEGYCILHGYKVQNHDCLGKLIKELLPDFDLVGFDRFRYVRNGII